MKTSTKNALVRTSVAGAAILVIAIPTFAQTASSTRVRGNGQNAQQRIQNMQNRGGQEIDQRVTSLNAQLTRIQAMTKVSDAEKAAFASSIQTEITTLASLKTQIAGDTSTTSLRADVQSITKAYRIYALVMPQTAIAAASDRVGTIAGMLTTISGKLQTRLSSATGLSGLATLQADLTDMNAKIADANTQAQAAVTEVASLKPDNGDQTVMASNTAALKDARSKIKTATADLQAADKDAKSIIQGLKGTGGSTSSTTSSQ